MPATTKAPPVSTRDLCQTFLCQGPTTAPVGSSALGDCTDPEMACSPQERAAAARVLREQATSTTLGMPGRDEAIRIATTNDVATFNRIDSTKAKLVRVGDVRAFAEPGARASSDDDQGWVVLTMGDISSDAARSIANAGPDRYSWWLTVIDAKTHQPVLFDGGQGAGPSYWASIPTAG
jgi:hypothetical protein